MVCRARRSREASEWKRQDREKKKRRKRKKRKERRIEVNLAIKLFADLQNWICIESF